MLSKAQYDTLGKDLIMKGVYDWLLKIDSGILQDMQAVKVSDNGVKYNVAATEAVGTWIDVGDVIPESTGTHTQRSAALYRYIKDADVDKMRADMGATQDIVASEIMVATREMLSGFHASMIYGQTTTLTSGKQPKGLLRLLAEIESETTTDLDSVNNGQVVANNATEAALTLAKLEQMMDQVKRGCNGLLMSRQTRRKIESLANAAGTPVQQDKDSYNHRINVYNGAKIYINDHMDNNFPDCSSSVLTIANHNRGATYSTSSADNTVILGFHLANDGVCMIETPHGQFQHEPPFTAPNKDAWRYRFKWYGGFACFDKFALAGLIGITTDAAS